MSFPVSSPDASGPKHTPPMFCSPLHSASFRPQRLERALARLSPTGRSKQWQLPLLLRISSRVALIRKGQEVKLQPAFRTGKTRAKRLSLCVYCADKGDNPTSKITVLVYHFSQWWGGLGLILAVETGLAQKKMWLRENDNDEVHQ